MKKIFHKIYLALLLVFFYLPIAYTVVFSFNDTIILDGGGYTLEWLGIKWYEHS